MKGGLEGYGEKDGENDVKIAELKTTREYYECFQAKSDIERYCK